MSTNNEKVNIDYHTMEDIIEIRKQMAGTHHHVSGCIDTSQELVKVLNENTARITAKDFCMQYLDHLLSDNEDESNYYRRLVSNTIGGFNRPFIIYDEEDDSPLFYVPGLSPTFNTTNGLDGQRTYTDLILEYVKTQHNLLPLVRDSRHSYFADVLNSKIATGDSIQKYYLGWYEIMDFFGRIPPDEEKYYRGIRANREKVMKYYYWIHKDLALDEFIRDKGRRLYGFKPDTSVISTPAQNKIELADNAIIDTEDWE